MVKPTMCGDNKIYLPENGCSDCSELDYRIGLLESWKEQFVSEGYNALANKPTINGVTVEGNKTSEQYLITPLSEADLVALTPLECYNSPCEDSRACYGEACCMIVGCDGGDDSSSSEICVGSVCNMEIACNNVGA